MDPASSNTTPSQPRFGGRVWRLIAATFVLFFVPLTLILGMFWGFGLLRAIKPSPDFIAEPDRRAGQFLVHSHQGDTLNNEVLLEKAWIAHFINPLCEEPCLPQIRAVRDIQYAVSKYKHFRVMTFSLEPMEDRNALWSLGRRFSNYPSWHFVAGDTAQLRVLMNSLGLAGRPEQFGRPDDVALVDFEGRVRGWYNPADSVGYSHLVNDIVLLLRHDEPQ
jgi:cytochrome oxidase Cu insertion factor (SCO1/SenC/PrrC family)